MEKRIMILGDNPESAVIVETANTMGCKTIVVGINLNTKPKKIASKSYDVNALNVDILVDIAKKENVNGVMVGVADILVPAYCDLCERLALPCYADKNAVEYLSDKIRFKEKCEEVGLPVIPEYDDNCLTVGDLPVVVKPVDSGGGTGISIVRSQGELNGAIQKAKEYSHSKRIQIEKYMDGDIIACYYTLIDGHVYLSSLEDNYFTRVQGDLCPVTTGHTYASRYLDLYLKKAHSKICQLLENVGAKNGILQINAFVVEDEFYFYDPGYRFQGEAQHHILQYINGFDHKEMMVNFAFSGSMYNGRNFEFANDPFIHGKSAASFWVLLKKGKIGKIEGLDHILSDHHVIYNGQRLSVGDEIKEYMLGTEKQVFSRIYVVCDTKEELALFSRKLHDTLVIEDMDGENMILDCLKI